MTDGKLSVLNMCENSLMYDFCMWEMGQSGTLACGIRSLRVNEVRPVNIGSSEALTDHWFSVS